MVYYSLGTFIHRIILLALLIGTGTACSTTQASMRGTFPGNEQVEGLGGNSKPNEQKLVGELDKYRNKLSDVYAVYENAIPDPFKSNDDQHVVSNPYQGYRIQLISTSNKEAAVEVMKDYNDWIFQQNDIPYKGNAYITFRQPDYKIHVGDFRSRQKAIEFSQKIKKKFPGAWIVNDTINPDRTPSDSTSTSNNGN